MASRKFHFFTDVNPQASSGPAYLNVQTAAGAFGPVTSNTANHDEYRVTSLHKATGFDSTAYAVCDGMICVQECLPVGSGLVNIILKPLVQPPLNFAPVKYIIYKGILASSLIAGAEVAPATATSNDLVKTIQDIQAKKNASAGSSQTAPKEALGIGLTGTGFADSDPIDNLFFRSGLSFQPPSVKGGWSIGSFDKSEFGIEVLMDGLNFRHSLKQARQAEYRVTVPSLVGGETAAKKFEHWHDKEAILGFMDPCAFYGSFFRAGILAKTSTDTVFTRKAEATLYDDILSLFHNKGISYVDVRNEHNFSFNYFGNFNDFVLVGNPPTLTDYYGSSSDRWPILTLAASQLAAGNTTKTYNGFQLRLEEGDNTKPLIYISQGYRELRTKGDHFPKELTTSERFFDDFLPHGTGHATPRKLSGPKSLTLVVPNIVGQGATTPASCYIRLKYLKRQHAAATSATTVQAGNYLDNLIWPVDLRLLQGGVAAISSSVYDEEVYVDASEIPGLEFDGIADMGIAQDSHNICLFLAPTAIRAQSGFASRLVAVSGEASTGTAHYPNFLALKYPREGVLRGDLKLSVTTTVPVADFVEEGWLARFLGPDFDKLIMLVMSRTTYAEWIARIGNGSSGLDNRFRTYLGVKTIQTQSDLAGLSYTAFELVLRGYALDGSGNAYAVKEIGSAPGGNVNISVYAHAGA
jgi:hypothetical protein